MRDRFDGEPGTQRNPRPLRNDNEWIVLPALPAKTRVPKRAGRDRFFTIRQRTAERRRGRPR